MMTTLPFPSAIIIHITKPDSLPYSPDVHHHNFFLHPPFIDRTQAAHQTEGSLFPTLAAPQGIPPGGSRQAGSRAAAGIPAAWNPASQAAESSSSAQRVQVRPRR